MEVQRDGGAWVQTNTLTSHTFTGLTSSTTYTFQVRAVDITGQIGSPSALQTVTTSNEVAPSQPATVTLTQKSTSTDGSNAFKLDLSYTAATQGTLPITGYEYLITRNSDSLVIVNWTTLTTAPGATFVVTGLTPSTGYTASVRAFTSSGTRGNARTATATTAGPKTNSAPTVNFVSENKNSGQTAASITFNYSASTGGTYPVTGYFWKLHTAAETTATSNPGVNVTTPEYSAGTTITISVRSIDSNGTYSSYGTLTYTIAVSIPGTPVLSYGSAWNTDITYTQLTWNAVSNATSYEIYDSSDNFIASTASRSYTFTGLSPGTSYYWKVRAMNGSVPGSFSSARGVTTGQKEVYGFRTLNTGPHNFTSDNKGCSGLSNTYGGSIASFADNNKVGYARVSEWRFSLRRVNSNTSVTCPTSGTRNCAAYWPGGSDSVVGTCFGTGAGLEYAYAVASSNGGSFSVQVSGSGWSTTTSSCTLNTPDASMTGFNMYAIVYETTANQQVALG